MSTTIFSGFKVVAKIGDTTFNNVSSVVIDLSASNIPAVALSLVPDGLEGEAATDGSPVISVITLAKVTDLYRKMMSIKGSGKPAALRVNVEVSDGDPIVVALDDWVVTGVGVGSGRRKADLVVRVELRHPAHKLVTTPCCAYNMSYGDDSNTDSDPSSFGTYADVLGLVVQALKAAADRAKKSMADSPDGSALAEYVVGELSKGAGYLEKYLRWGDGGGLPPDKLLASVLVSHASDSALSAAASGASVWAWLSQSVVPSYFLHIRSTYMDEQLVLEPFNPWGEPVGDIAAADVIRIDHPPSDILPLRGLFTVYDAMVAVGSTDGNVFSGQPVEYSKRVVAFAPEELRESPVGQLAHIRMPDWVMHTSRILASAAAAMAPDSATEETTPFASAGDATQAAVATTVLQQLFSGLYMQNHSMALTLRYSPHIVAGAVYTLGATSAKLPDGADVVEEPEEPSSLFTFYATRVTHVISATDRTCVTQVQGAYVRSAVKDDGVFIPEGTNVIYGK